MSSLRSSQPVSHYFSHPTVDHPLAQPIRHLPHAPKAPTLFGISIPTCFFRRRPCASALHGSSPTPSSTAATSCPPSLRARFFCRRRPCPPQLLARALLGRCCARAHASALPPCLSPCPYPPSLPASSADAAPRTSFWGQVGLLFHNSNDYFPFFFFLV